MDSESYQLLINAISMRKNNDPNCIPIFENLDTFAARSHLAKIYMEGGCGQNVDYEKALSYTKNNPNILAIAVEARINVILLNKEETYDYYYKILTEKYEENKRNGSVNLVLSEMYLQGKGTDMNLQKALTLNPHLSDSKTLIWELKFTDEETRKKLRQKMIRDPIFQHKMEVLDKFEPNNTSMKQPEKNENISDKEKIDRLIKERVDQKIVVEACIEWFEMEPRPISAYYIMRNIKGTDNEYKEKAAAILRTALNNPLYLRAVIEYDYSKRLWDELEQLLAQSDDKRLDYYRAQVALHNNDNENAIKYLLSTIKQNKNGEKYNQNAVRSMAKVLELKPEWVMFYHDYSELLLKSNNIKDRYIAASAMYDYGDPSSKKKAIDVLRKDSSTCYEAAEKMYQISSDDSYKKRMDELSFSRSENTKQYFDYRDDTKTILENYGKLSPKWKLTAIDVLIQRFEKGKDEELLNSDVAANLLEEEIGICEKYGLSSKHPKGRLGHLMYKKKIPCIDETLMFKYLYDVRHEPVFRPAVVECLISGRGTEKNMEKAINLLKEDDIRFNWRRLLDIYQKEEFGYKDPKRVVQIVRELIDKGTIQEEFIKILRETPSELMEPNIEMTYSEYTPSKVFKLMNSAQKSEDPNFKLRCYDFARKLGSTQACKKEAVLLIKHYQNPKLAYTILKQSEVDASSFSMRMIGPKDQIMVDAEKDLKSLMGKQTNPSVL